MQNGSSSNPHAPGVSSHRLLPQSPGNNPSELAVAKAVSFLSMKCDQSRSFTSAAEHRLASSFPCLNSFSWKSVFCQTIQEFGRANCCSKVFIVNIDLRNGN